MATPTKPAYVTPLHIKEIHDISTSTLRRWSSSGKIRFITVPATGRRLYHEEDVRKQIGVPDDCVEVQKPRKVTILYSRVNDDSQSEDLQKQKEELARAYPNGEHAADVASGLDWNRHGLEGVLGRVCRGEVETLVVSHKDRLARYGVELVEWILCQNSTKLVVLHEANNVYNPKELQSDLLQITTFFVGQNSSGNVKADPGVRRRGKGTPNPRHKDQDSTRKVSAKGDNKVGGSREENL